MTLKITLRTDGSAKPDIRLLFMGVAKLMAQRSSCPDGARHGAVLVLDNRIVSTGYGSPARGVEPCSKCWLRECKKADGSKDWEVCPSVHAEVNAILNAARNGVSTKGATLYTTKDLCDQCRRMAFNAGIEEYVVEDEKHDLVFLPVLDIKMVSIKEFVRGG